jgi:predicted RNA-binding protein with PIN domain
LHTIIDGYNLIFALGWDGKTRHSKMLERSRDRLIRELADRIPVDLRAGITIVFDAKSTPIKATEHDSVVNGFRVMFAHQHDEADTLIEELIRVHSTPKSLTVVSNDNRLKTAAQRRKAVAMDCEVWLERMGALSDDQQKPGAKSLRGRKSGIQGSRKSESIRQLEGVDWLAEFQIADDETVDETPVDATVIDLPPQKTPQNESSPPPRIDDEPYNPFPPGYGEDLLDD